MGENAAREQNFQRKHGGKAARKRMAQHGGVAVQHGQPRQKHAAHHPRHHAHGAIRQGALHFAAGIARNAFAVHHAEHQRFKKHAAHKSDGAIKMDDVGIGIKGRHRIPLRQPENVLRRF